MLGVEAEFRGWQDDPLSWSRSLEKKEEWGRKGEEFRLWLVTLGFSHHCISHNVEVS